MIIIIAIIRTLRMTIMTGCISVMQDTIILEHNKRQNIKPINLKAIAVLNSYSILTISLVSSLIDLTFHVFLAGKSTTRHRNKRRKW